MSGCCKPAAYGDVFDERQAQKDLRRYRRRGLDRAARHIVDFLAARGIVGSTVLEVGGGIGAVHAELLRVGAGRAVNAELSSGYEKAAAELTSEQGIADDRIERRIADFARDASTFEAADAVLLHRVVCCYPDYEALLGAAAEKALRLLVFSYPRGGLLARLAVAGFNLYMRLSGTDFRSYAHPRRALLALPATRGLHLVAERRSLFWRVAAFERAA